MNFLYKCRNFIFLLSGSFLEATVIRQVSLSQFLSLYPHVEQMKCSDRISVSVPQFPLYKTLEKKYFPSRVSFFPLSIIKIPKGMAYFDATGYTFLNNCFIKEMQIKHLNFFNNQNACSVAMPSSGIKVPGTVAIVSHLYPYCYGHWIFDVLGQLALLEMHQIDYDYICIPYYKKFMKESLELWGIDSSKIIPLSLQTALCADTIVMTTPVTQTDEIILNANYNVDFILKYVQSKLLLNLSNSAVSSQFCKKIFISRKDAGGKRVIPNEDEIFALFEEIGFKRYELSLLSFAQQIALFQQAEVVVNFVGSGATNLIFCKPGTMYLEITQKMVDATFFYVAAMFGIHYYFINSSTIGDVIKNDIWAKGEVLSIQLVKDFLEKHPEFKK